MPELNAYDICNTQPMAGDSGLSFTLEFSSHNEKWDNVNPYNICDGKWGGWGPAEWFTFPWSNKNVFEIDTNISKENLAPGILCIRHSYWKRCWDNTTKEWRSITEEEMKQLPVLEKQEVPDFKFDKVMVPMIKRVSKTACI